MGPRPSTGSPTRSPPPLRSRIEQSDETRGFKVKYFDTDLSNSLRLMWDNAMWDNTTSSGTGLTTTTGVAALVDSSRIRIRPFVNSLFYFITAPTFYDGDSVRAVSKWGLEVRNTAADSIAAHQLITNLNLT